MSVASARKDSARVVSAGPSVSAPNPTAKKGREIGKAKKGRGRGKAAAASTSTRRSARLTAKPAQTYVVEFPQITDAEESDEDDGVEYEFRWEDGDF